MCAIQLVLWLNATNTWNLVPGQLSKVTSIIGSFVLASAYAIARGIAKNKGVIDKTDPNNYTLIPKNPNKRKAV